MCRCSTQKQHFHTPTPHQPKLKNLFCVLPDNPLTLQLALRFSNFHTTAHKTPDFQLPNARHPLRKKVIECLLEILIFRDERREILECLNEMDHPSSESEIDVISMNSENTFSDFNSTPRRSSIQSWIEPVLSRAGNWHQIFDNFHVILFKVRWFICGENRWNCREIVQPSTPTVIQFSTTSKHYDVLVTFQCKIYINTSW